MTIPLPGRLGRSVGAGDLTPLQVAAVYAAFGLGLLVVSDVVFPRLIADPALLAAVQAAKGAVEVGASAVLIYLLLARGQRDLRLKNRAIEAAPIGITISDATGEDNPIVYANDGFEELTGYDHEAAAGRNHRFLQGPATRERPVAEMRAAIDEERPVTVELRNYRADGTQFWNRVSVAPVRDDDGEVTNYAGFQQDVTDRRETTRQLRVLHRVLRHDVANQMSIVRGNAEQLAEDATGRRRELADGIVEEVDRFVEAADTHRTIVGLLSERPAPRTLSLTPAVVTAVESVRRDHPSATLSVDVDDLGAVRGLPVLEAAVAELVENAVVHGGGPDSVVRVGGEADGGVVRLTVADEGPGLPEEEAAVLTGEQDVDPVSHGAGMGLWFVYWVVQLSGGAITVTDNEPRGTVVTVELSLADAAGDRPAAGGAPAAGR